MRITDNTNISTTLEKDYGNVVICDNEVIREFVDELRKRISDIGSYYGGGNLRCITVVTSELSCELASKCDERNIYETVYEVWYDTYAASGEMKEILKCIDDMRNKKIMFNSMYGIISPSRYMSDFYTRSRDEFREKLFSYMEKRSDVFNRECVTSISL